MFFSTAEPPPTALPQDPYRGLAFFRSPDRLLFSGRDQEIEICANFLAESRTRALILQGQTGSGKSSFLRAGLIPTLERRGFSYHFLRTYENDQDVEGSVTFIRCGSDPIGRIAEALFVYSSRPISITTIQGRRSADLSVLRQGCATIREFVDLCRKPGALLSSLRLLSHELDYTLLIVIDQAEEVISLSDISNTYRAQFFGFMQEFMAYAFPVKLLLAIRKDYSGEFVELSQIGRSISISPATSEGARDPLVVSDLKMFTLAPLSKRDVMRAMRIPTLQSIPGSSESPRVKYGFSFSRGVSAKILRDLFQVSSSVLPAMQLVCRDLYQRASTISEHRKVPKLIDLELYRKGKRVEGPVDRHISKSLRDSFGSAITGERALSREEDRGRRLLYSLVRREADNSVHSTQVSLAEMRSRAKSLALSAPLDEMLNYLAKDDILLLRASSILSAPRPEERKVYSLGHDFIGGVLYAWHQKRETVRQTWRQIGIGAGGAILAGIVAWVIVWQANVQVHRGMLRGEFTDLLSMAEIRLRESPFISLNLAGQAMAINSEFSQTLFGSSDDGAGEMVSRIASRLPRTVNLSGKTPATGSFNAPLPLINGFIYVDRGKAAIFSNTGATLRPPYPISRFVTPNETVDGYELAEAPGAGVLLLEMVSTTDTLSLREQLLILKPNGNIGGPYNITNLEQLEPRSKNTQRKSFSGLSGMFLSGDTITISNLATKQFDTFVFDANQPRGVPFRASNVANYSLAWTFVQDHAVGYVNEAGTGVGNVQMLSSANPVTLTSYDLAKGGSRPIHLGNKDAFKSCLSDSRPAQPCDWVLLPSDRGNTFLLYGALSLPKARTAYSNSTISPTVENLKRLLVVDTATGKMVSVDIDAWRGHCIVPSLTAPGEAPASGGSPTSAIISGGTIESLLLGFVSGSSVDLLRVSTTPSGQQISSCIGTIYAGDKMSRWAISKDGETVLATGPSGGAVWQKPETIDSTYSELIALQRGESKQFRDAQIMAFACKAGLSSHELRGNQWVSAVDLQVPTRELCAHGELKSPGVTYERIF